MKKLTPKKIGDALVLSMPIVILLFVIFHFVPLQVDIGEFDTDDAAIKASIKAISSNIKPYPIFNKYHVSWKSKETQWGATTMYIRSEKVIGYEVDVGSGFAESQYNVTAKDIHRIAEINGNFEDFKHLKAQE